MFMDLIPGDYSNAPTDQDAAKVHAPKIDGQPTMVNLRLNEEVVEKAANVAEDLRLILNWVEKGRIDLAKEGLGKALNNANLVSGSLTNAYQGQAKS